MEKKAPGLCDFYGLTLYDFLEAGDVRTVVMK